MLPAALGQSSPHRYAQDATFASTSRIVPGTYGVYVSAGSRQGTPRLALPLAGNDGVRRYRLGEVTVRPGSGATYYREPEPPFV